MNCAGKTSVHGLSYVAFLSHHEDGQELLCCGERGCFVYDVQRDAVRRVLELAPLAVAVADRSKRQQLLAVVGSGDRHDYNPRRVVVLDTSVAPPRPVESLLFRTVVLGVALAHSRRLMAVCTETSVDVFNLDNHHRVGAHATCLNPTGLFSLSRDGKRLAVPLAASTIAISDTSEELLQLHTDAPFGKMQFNAKGDMLAVASADGTTCWVYAVRSQVDHSAVTFAASKLFVFLRGSAAASIEGLCFNSDCTLLAVSGDSGTLHVFELSDSHRYSTSGFSAYLPSMLSSRMTPRSALRIALPSRSSCVSALLLNTLLEATSSHAAVDGIASERRVLVANADGVLLDYSLQPASLAAGADDSVPSSDGVGRDVKPKAKRHIVYPPPN